jgi:methylthioribose-1-phosphate isomerase
LNPIKWANGLVIVLDERFLPESGVYHICRDYPEVAEAIRSEVIQNSSVLRIAVAMGIALGAQRSSAQTAEEFDDDFENICLRVAGARPGDENVTRIVEQFGSIYRKYRASGMLVVRIALVVEALILQTEESEEWTNDLEISREEALSGGTGAVTPNSRSRRQHWV